MFHVMIGSHKHENVISYLDSRNVWNSMHGWNRSTQQNQRFVDCSNPSNKLGEMADQEAINYGSNIVLECWLYFRGYSDAVVLEQE